MGEKTRYLVNLLTTQKGLTRTRQTNTNKAEDVRRKFMFKYSFIAKCLAARNRFKRLRNAHYQWLNEPSVTQGKI